MGLLDTMLGKNWGEKSVSRGTLSFNKDNSIVKKFNEEVSIELFTELNSNDIITSANKEVRLHQIPNMIKIEYSGFLAQNGAGEVYAVIGYGSNDNWENVETFPMRKTAGQKFELLTFRRKPGNINMAFKDNANNWDNNYGNNYIFQDQNQTSDNH